MSEQERRIPKARERVTAPEAITNVRGPKVGPLDADTIYVRSLVRSQLRLAIACAVGFVVLLAGFAYSFVLSPDLGTLLVAGVPVSWLMLGFGVYPMVIGIAVIYVRAARRNEAGYISLTDRAGRDAGDDPA